MRRYLVSPTSLVTIFLIFFVSMVMIFRAQEGAQKLSIFEGKLGPFELVVQMSFAPEAFHLAKLQDVGRIASVEGSTVHLRSVKRDELREIAWFPWVDSISPFEEKVSQ